jgi:dTDP-4-amino-4,6-dideoxygalactose transaminase
LEILAKLLNRTSKMNSKIWLSSPHMGGKEFEYVKEAFDTNWIAPLGPHVDGFEQDIADRLGENVHVAALSSGTAALHLALVQLGVQHGDEVICQSMTFSASANPIKYQSAMPVFVDSEPDTWNMDPTALKTAIRDRLSKGKRPKAIITVHLYGMPAKMKEILAIAEEYQIPVIEDAAEALGSTYRGRAMGTFGDFSILSFNGNKIITTSGGGALVSKNKKTVEYTRFLATQARDAAVHYEHSQVGYNYRMSNVCAGIGRGQMEVLTDRVNRRREINQYYRQSLSNIPGISFLSEPSADYFSNYWLTTIIVDHPKFTREGLRLALAVDNIESRPLWKPMHLQPVFSGTPFYGDGTSGSLFEKGLCLPSGSNLTDNDLKRITGRVLDYFH